MDDFDAEKVVKGMRALSEVFENLGNSLKTITESLHVLSEAYFSQFEDTEEDFEDEDSDIPEPNDDYILRSDALEIAMEWCPDDDGSVGKVGDLREMLDELESISAADVVPVVRCKDCKYKPTAPDGITYGLQVDFPDEWANRCPCLCEDGWYSWVPDDDFFCGYGAKMDAEPPKEGQTDE